MKYEGISFNTKAILELKQDQFVKRFSHAWPKVEKKVREDRLKEVYKLAKIHENARKLN
jgi:hypothetical protein